MTRRSSSNTRSSSRRVRAPVNYQLLHSGEFHHVHETIMKERQRGKTRYYPKKRSGAPKRVETSGTSTSASGSDNYSSSEDEFADVVCHECGSGSDICKLEKEPHVSQDIILCDGKGCNKAYHFRCNEVPLFSTPSSMKKWICFLCQCAKNNKSSSPRTSRRNKLISSRRDETVPLNSSVVTLKTELILNELKVLRQRVSKQWIKIAKMEDVIRTFESMKNQPAKGAFEFVELKHARSKRKKFQREMIEMVKGLHGYIISNPFSEPRFDDESSEISATDMRCSFCRHNSSTDENDIFMCDHTGCGRMMHQNCFAGNIDPDEEKDWFCPFCDTLSEILDFVENAHNEYHHDNISIDSVDDLVSLFASTESICTSESEADSDDSDYSKCMSHDNDGSDSSSENDEYTGSIDDDEIRHLMKDMTNDESEIFETRDQLVRVIKENASKVEDLGELREENIVIGKRKRMPIDYQVLNSALFGTISNKDLDDEEEF